RTGGSGSRTRTTASGRRPSSSIGRPRTGSYSRATSIIEERVSRCGASTTRSSSFPAAHFTGARSVRSTGSPHPKRIRGTGLVGGRRGGAGNDGENRRRRRRSGGRLEAQLLADRRGVRLQHVGLEVLPEGAVVVAAPGHLLDRLLGGPALDDD